MVIDVRDLPFGLDGWSSVAEASVVVAGNSRFLTSFGMTRNKGVLGFVRNDKASFCDGYSFDRRKRIDQYRYMVCIGPSALKGCASG
jgi:hypothetical protein